jgi:methionyl-tRNA formyltransferase
MDKKIKLIYIGTSEISVLPLEKLISNNDFELMAVVTQPDKPIGRKKIISPPPVKLTALNHKINVLQPEKISQISKEIEKLSPDIVMVMAYAQLIPESILHIAKYGTINIHTSLLPNYRGASPIQAAIMNGDQTTGITFMLMDKGLDTGLILSQFVETIRPNDTTTSLSKRLSVLATENISNVINDFINKKIFPQKQDNDSATFVKELNKNDGMINWSEPSKKIERFIRAMYPWPVAFTTIDKTRLKIYSAEISPIDVERLKIGTVTLIEKKLAIKSGDRLIILIKVQTAGGKIMDSKDYILGHSDLIGKIAK